MSIKPEERRLIFSGLLVLLILAAAGMILTSSWTNSAPNPGVTQTSAETNLVDQRPLDTAQQLAGSAVTSAEQQYAQQAVRLADHEVDMAFDYALDEATRHPPPLNAKAKEIEAHIQRRQARVNAQQARVALLTQLIAKATAARKAELQPQLELVQSQLSLDQDQLGDSQQDLIRAGGDLRGKIQAMLQAHEETSAHKGDGSIGAGPNSQEAAIEQTTAHNVLAEFRAWKSLHEKQERVDAARQDTLNRAKALTVRQQALEKEIEARANPAAAPSGTAHPAQAGGPAATAASLSHFRRLSDEQRTLDELDRRIEDEQGLASVYGNWSALIVSREHMFLHGLIASAFWILLIAFIVSLSDQMIQRFLLTVGAEMARFRTLRSVLVTGTEAIGIVIILLVIFGMPSQFGTFLALIGAGLTIALKDFIVGFFGWFVLMGRNGIRPGDWVEINGVAGEVFEVGWLRTVLLETGDWSDAGHPTGRKVTFVNSFAIEGHYFNFSTSGQWMWDELQVTIPADRDPYPVAEEIKKIIAQETDANAHLAEQEWERVTLSQGPRAFKAEPAINLRPADGGVSVAVRYITRANERHELRTRLYRSVLELLHRDQISLLAEKTVPQSVPTAE